MKKKIFLIFITFFLFTLNVNAASIEEGIYKIQSALDSNKVLDLYSGKSYNNNNIQLYQYNDSNAQKWYIKNAGDGYYSITSLIDENFSLDVKSAGRSNGTNVQLYQYNSSNAQKWYIKDAGDGYYYLVSKCNNLYMDVKGGSTRNSTNIQMYKGNGTKAQKFKLIEIINGSYSIEDGIYKISSKIDKNYVFDINNNNPQNRANVLLKKDNNSLSQYWNLKYLNNGYYSITSFLNNYQSLDVAGASSVSRTNVWMFNSNYSNAQSWLIRKTNDGYFNIISKLDHAYLDVAGGKAQDNSNIWIYRNNNSNAQKFSFEKVTHTSLEDGLYTIGSATNSNMLLSLNTEISINKANVLLEENRNTNRQKWYIKNLGNGYYSIKTALDGLKSMDVYGASTSSGSNVQLYAYNGTGAQTWYIKDNMDGTYSFVSKCNNLFLDVKGGKIENGSNIQMYYGNGSSAQRFVLSKTELNPESKTFDNGYYTISSIQNEKFLLDATGARKLNGTNIQLYERNYNNAQTWKLTYLNNGYYSITTAMNPNVALDLSSSTGNAQLYRYNGSNNQTWYLKDLGDKKVSIISKENGNYLTIDKTANNFVNVSVKPYNMEESQQFKLTEFTQKKTYNGIDVSHHQKQINWNKVEDSIDFAIIRGGYGDDWTHQDDKFFQENIKGCNENNIPYGLYLYSYASDVGTTAGSAEAEAKHMLRLIDSIKESNSNFKLGTKVFIDMEDASVISAGKQKLTEVVDTFCTIIQNNGYKCGVYANINWFTNYLDAQYLHSKYTIWLANYLPVYSPSYSYAKTKRPNYNLTPYNYWQFASDGRIAGIEGNVDLDLGYDIFD